MAKETAVEQKRNPDGTFAGPGGDDGGNRTEAIEPGTSEDRERFEASLEREGLTAEEGSSRIEDLMQAAEEAGVEVPDGADPEALEAARERLDEDGSIEAAVEALELGMQDAEAAEAEPADDGSGSVPFDALAEEHGVSADDVTVTAKVDGEEVELSLSEALQGYQRQEAFTKKTQELADKRREVEQVGEQYAQGLEMLAVTLGRNLSPEQQQALVSEYNRVVGQISEATAPDPDTVEQEREQLRESFGWDDPETWEEARGNLRSYAHELGFADEELSQVTDSRVMTVLEKARRYDALQGEASELSEKAAKRRGASRTLMPGARSGKKGRSKSREAMARLRESGSAEDAAAAILEGGLLGDGS